MKKSLAHLPDWKKAELKEIVRLVREMVTVEMIILFGSHARGDWVEDTYLKDGILYTYRSDFDVLAVVESKRVSRRHSLWHDVEAALRNAPGIRTLVGLIADNIAFVNQKLSEGHYFFTDIKKEGILLYDSKRFKLACARRLDNAERRRLAEQDFRKWFKSAGEFFEGFQFHLGRKHYNNAAFQLHQATERYYSAVRLVFTHYKPKLHDIEELGRQCAGHDPRFLKVFPLATKDEKRLFGLLKRAYVDARYDPGYKVTKKELEYLAARVGKLRALTRKACREKIATFGAKGPEHA